jgi:hypothetical protein
MRKRDKDVVIEHLESTHFNNQLKKSMMHRISTKTDK